MLGRFLREQQLPLVAVITEWTVRKRIPKSEIETTPDAYRLKCLLKDDPQTDAYCGFEGSVWVEPPLSAESVSCPDCGRRMALFKGGIRDGSDRYVFDSPELHADHLTPEFRQKLEQEHEDAELTNTTDEEL